MLYVMEYNVRRNMTDNYNSNFNQPNGKDKQPVYDSFIDSIEEEIRKENYQKLWNKYGKLITIVVSLALVGTTGYSFWKKHDLQEKEAISAQFTIALNELNSDKNGSALAHFRELGKCKKKNYATFAKFEYATLLMDKRDKKAIAEYKSICDDKKVEQLYRDLAYVYYVNASLDLLDEKELKAKIPEFIKKLSNKYIGKKWNFLALESLGYCYVKQHNYVKARDTFSELAKSEKIPEAMLERTREMIQYVNQQIDQLKTDKTEDSDEGKNQKSHNVANQKKLKNK